MAASFIGRTVANVGRSFRFVSAFDRFPRLKCPKSVRPFGSLSMRSYSQVSDDGSTKGTRDPADDPTPGTTANVEQSHDHVSVDAELDNVHKSASPGEGALDKFARVVDKVKKAQQQETVSKETEHDVPEDPSESFASMFRRSKFVSLGEHKDRFVQGEIFEVMDDDLYIDFGGKFHCVCPRPKRNGERYQRGTKVLLSLQCMEMSSAFLGSDIPVTLLEADATLMGLASVPKTQTQRNRQQEKKQ